MLTSCRVNPLLQHTNSILDDNTAIKSLICNLQGINQQNKVKDITTQFHLNTYIIVQLAYE